MHLEVSRFFLVGFAVFLSLWASELFADDSAVTVSPRALLAEFDENALALERKYAGRPINISGRIAGISKERGGQPTVRIASPPERAASPDAADKTAASALAAPSSEGLDCQFKEDQLEALVKLKKDQPISALCEKVTIKKRSVSLSECRLVDLP